MKSLSENKFLSHTHRHTHSLTLSHTFAHMEIPLPIEPILFDPEAFGWMEERVVGEWRRKRQEPDPIHLDT